MREHLCSHMATVTNVGSTQGVLLIVLSNIFNSEKGAIEYEKTISSYVRYLF